MKLYRLERLGTLDGLTLLEEREPRPGPREVAIRIRAASLNYRDLKVAAGAYEPGHIRPRVIPLSDAAGEVVETGPDATRVSVGDRVAPIFLQRWLAGRSDPAYASSALGGPSDGVLAERVVLSEEGVVRLPPHLSFEEAATLPCAALTAWHALFDCGRLTAGETVLTIGTGGVSLFAIQFARLAGARPIVLSGSAEKIERLKSLGVTDIVNYRATPDWERAVMDLTGGKGADHVLELGGAATFRKSLLALRSGGRLYAIGNLAGEGQINPLMILAKRANVHGIQVGSRAMFEAMNRAIALARLRPVVDRVFPFAEARAAYEHLEHRRHFGKVVIAL